MVCLRLQFGAIGPSPIAVSVRPCLDSMPFNPFHFGPGAAIKAVIPAQFSLVEFCYAQVVTD
jgi:hypothetical protein